MKNLFERERAIYEKLLEKIKEEKSYLLKADFENVEKAALEISEIIKELSNILSKRKEILENYKGDEEEMNRFLEERVKGLKELLNEVIKENDIVHKILTFDLEFINKSIEVLRTKTEGEKNGTFSNNA
ncbi:MAG: flagellar protein FlgN [bacterium]|nr:flagellar protein FlgN [bacterium]MDW8163474.1 flagellar export chaperone FlgN [Candidatus Omnitrophota bacterium]